MLKTKDEVINISKQYKDFLKKFLTIQDCYLFGSYAENEKKVHEWSDIDIAVVSPDFENMTIEAAFKLLFKATKEISTLIEPVPLPPDEIINSEVGTIGYTVIKHGIKI